VRYAIGQRPRVGVASTFFAERIAVGTRLKAYVQKAHAFGLPADPTIPIIMIGPGTGVAPFRAFLHERMATRAPGRNWLFFGHQRRDYDFFYEDELIGMKAAGVLTRLSLAWSRDDRQKFYVQDRMREVGRELWAWLADGAHVYVCGAMTMGKDVERALFDIIAAHGARPADQAAGFLAELKKNQRYQTDVY
jgi:sulfite reductase (NADPH) flavoprotein alpha-component